MIRSYSGIVEYIPDEEETESLEPLSLMSPLSLPEGQGIDLSYVRFRAFGIEDEV